MNDPLLDDFLSTKNPQTQRVYHTILQHYMTYTGKSMTELVEEAEEEQYGNVLKRKRKIKGYLSGFKQYREDMGHSPHTVKNSITTVRGFYRRHGITPPLQRLEYRATDTIGRVARSVDDLPGRSEIIKAIGNSNIKYRALITVMATSGMDGSPTLNHTVQSFITGLGENAETHLNGLLDVGETRHKLSKSREPVVKWKAHRSKTTRDPDHPHYYTTYSTPEAVMRVLDYLEASPPLDVGDPLWRVGPQHRPLRALSVQDYLRNLNRRCGWGKQGRMIYLRSHNLRKYFANTLQATGMKHHNIEHLLDHTVGGSVHQAYFKVDEDELRREYLQYMPALSLEKEMEVLTVTTDDLARLDEQDKRIQHLEKYIQDLERHRPG